MFNAVATYTKYICLSTRSRRGNWIARAKLSRGDQVASLEVCPRLNESSPQTMERADCAIKMESRRGGADAQSVYLFEKNCTSKAHCDLR
ncbi:hypothetical protein Y032_0731g1903 [Ancylostoma ceylanicum]|uniref:Uncharacterized protein n=1 Tax=Ancylostoma ceylanicum TaxID=53326 RepID=A0A016WGV2_9BILA|nr:hypothetical protein Y032_0731g1903 [Ancylostoma ceylanicum]